MNRITTAITTAIIALVASSCVAPVLVKPTPPVQTSPIQFDLDLDGVAEDYWYPEFHAEVAEPSPGTFVATVGADQRSADAGQGQSTMTVTVGDESVCDNDTFLLVGTCLFTTDGPEYVEVRVSWRETTETLWTGWVA